MDERVSFFRLGDGAAADAPSRVAMMPKRPATAQSRPPADAAQRRHSAAAHSRHPAAASAAQAKRGPIPRAQTALATAVKDDPDWKEF
jgi:hypothetical protein